MGSKSGDWSANPVVCPPETRDERYARLQKEHCEGDLLGHTLVPFFTRRLRDLFAKRLWWGCPHCDGKWEQ